MRSAWHPVPLLRPAGPDLLDRRHRVAQLGEPLLGVLTDQADRPDQRLGTGARDTGVDEGVEHQPLGLAQTGHHRHRLVGEHLPDVAADRTPGDRAAVALLRRVGDGHPLLAGLLAEAGAPAGPPRRLVALARLGLGQRADDGDLVAVDDQLDRPGEPAVGQPPGEPAGHLPPGERRAALGPASAASSTTPGAGELAGEGPSGKTMSVHDTLPASVLITQLHGKPKPERQEGLIAALRADTSVTGAEQTKPRQT